MMAKPELAIGVEPLRFSSDDVVSALASTAAGPIEIRGLEINCQTYPAREGLARVTGWDLLDFNINRDRNTFRRLGFNVVRVGCG